MKLVRTNISYDRWENNIMTQDAAQTFAENVIGEPVWGSPIEKTRQIGKVVSSLNDPINKRVIIEIELFPGEAFDKITHRIALKGVSIGGMKE